MAKDYLLDRVVCIVSLTSVFTDKYNRILHAINMCDFNLTWLKAGWLKCHKLIVHKVVSLKVPFVLGFPSFGVARGGHPFLLHWLRWLLRLAHGCSQLQVSLGAQFREWASE